MHDSCYNLFICRVNRSHNASVIFHVENHPEFPQFVQCVSFNFFPTPYHKNGVQYLLSAGCLRGSLAIIIFCYSSILWVISRRSRDSDAQSLFKYDNGDLNKVLQAIRSSAFGVGTSTIVLGLQRILGPAVDLEDKLLYSESPAA
ncbi:gonadotropin-releasing hormone II receptor [Caerostris extrusa]|uniref:Gonadotropin-releasing hormone II receptor n=1 Tax=Caerostris extrusa TaxID=172846 RepID=A0AAV4M3E4_CAEEX|nr:gonadotropin-releasing hormone II receptor [Caerostris extrusa]